MLKKVLWIVAAGLSVMAQPLKSDTVLDYATPTQTKQWFNAARFGIYLDWTARINFDPKSVEKTPYMWGDIRVKYKSALYRDIKDAQGNPTGRHHWEEWNPTRFDAQEWIDTFVDAGAKFLTFEIVDDYGFTMCDSPGTTLDMAGTLYGKDICRALGKAAEGKLPMIWEQRQYGGIDYILGSWNYLLSRLTADTPGYPEYRKKTLYHIIGHPEIYGKAAAIAFAGNEGGKTISEHPAREGDYAYQFDQAHSDYIKNLLARQPWLIFSTRFALGDDPHYNKNFEFAKMRFANYNKHIERDDLLRIALFSLESDLDGWADVKGHNSRTAYEIIKMLTFAATRDENFAVRVTPDANGSIPDYQKEALRGVGEWLKKYGESIYGTRNGPYAPGPWGGSTRKGNTIYLHLTQNRESGAYRFPKLPGGIKKVELLNDNKALRFTNDSSGFAFDIGAETAKKRTVPDRIVKITYGAGVDTLDSNRFPDTDEGLTYEESLCVGDSVTASSTSASPHINAPASVLTAKILAETGGDGKYLYPRTFWSAREPFDGGTPLSGDVTVTVDFDRAYQFDQVMLIEKHNRIRDWRVEYQDTGGSWHTIYHATDEPIAIFEWKMAQKVDAQKLRIVISRYEGGAPQLRAIRVFASQ